MARKRKLEDVASPLKVKKSKVATMSSQQTIEQPEQALENPDAPPQDDDKTNSVPATQDHISEPSEILPVNLMHLVQKYSFARMSIKSNSKINSKVKNLLAHMSKFSFADKDPKPGIIVIDARGSDATKMLSVIEIAKREIETEERSGKWFQYSRVSSELTRIPRQLKRTSSHIDENINEKDAANPEGEENTTTTKAAADADTKLRAVPVLTIYMTRISIPELKQEYGEQTNASSLDE